MKPTVTPLIEEINRVYALRPWGNSVNYDGACVFMLATAPGGEKLAVLLEQELETSLVRKDGSPSIRSHNKIGNGALFKRIMKRAKAEGWSFWLDNEIAYAQDFGHFVRTPNFKAQAQSQKLAPTHEGEARK